MGKNIEQTIEMLKSCDNFFMRYQPLFANDEVMLGLWDSFRATEFEIQQTVDQESENCDRTDVISQEKKERFAQQIFKVGAFLQVLSNESNDEILKEMCCKTLEELFKESVCSLSKIATDYQQICVQYIDQLQPLAFKKGMLEELVNTRDHLEESCVLGKIEEKDFSFGANVKEAEGYLLEVDALMKTYNAIYSGVVLEYFAIRHPTFEENLI